MGIMQEHLRSQRSLVAILVAVYLTADDCLWGPVANYYTLGVGGGKWE